MNLSCIFREAAASWQIATGHPLPFVHLDNESVPEQYPVYFPVIGFVMGLLFSLIAIFLVPFHQNPSFLRILMASVLITALSELVTRGDGLNAASAFAIRRFPRLSGGLFKVADREFPVVALVLLFLKLALIGMLIQRSGNYWFMILFTAAYFGRIQLGAAVTPAGRDLLPAHPDARKRALIVSAVIGILLALWLDLAGIISAFFIAGASAMYFVPYAGRRTIPVDRSGYQAYGYLLELALLLCSVLLLG